MTISPVSGITKNDALGVTVSTALAVEAAEDAPVCGFDGVFADGAREVVRLAALEVSARDEVALLVRLRSAESDGATALEYAEAEPPPTAVRFFAAVPTHAAAPTAIRQMAAAAVTPFAFAELLRSRIFSFFTA